MRTAGALRNAPPAGRHALPHQSRVVALVPAHDEEAQIGAALAALSRQTRRPDLVVVVCDNCTDRTAPIARRSGAAVLVTEGNRDKKAGALNQALSRVLPLLDDDDVILVQDADSQPDPTFLDHALRYLRRGYGGVTPRRRSGSTSSARSPPVA